jgi:hypothetical protein
MLTHLVTAAVGMALLAAGWLWIQRAWTRAFPDACADPDPLAERLGCHGCELGENCERRPAPRAHRPGGSFHE